MATLRDPEIDRRAIAELGLSEAEVKRIRQADLVPRLRSHVQPPAVQQPQRQAAQPRWLEEIAREDHVTPDELVYMQAAMGGKNAPKVKSTYEPPVIDLARIVKSDGGLDELINMVDLTIRHAEKIQKNLKVRLALSQDADAMAYFTDLERNVAIRGIMEQDQATLQVIRDWAVELAHNIRRVIEKRKANADHLAAAGGVGDAFLANTLRFTMIYEELITFTDLVK
jgi:hypothetical protein